MWRRKEKNIKLINKKDCNNGRNDKKPREI